MKRSPPLRAAWSVWPARNGPLRVSVLLAVLPGALLAGGCSKRGVSTLPPPPTIVAVNMYEYRFDFNKVIPPGRVIFRLHNRGRLDHNLVLVRLAAGQAGRFDAQLKGSVRRPTETVNLLPLLRPGERTVFAADLPPGNYGFVCFVQDGDSKTHAVKGMNAEFQTG